MGSSAAGRLLLFVPPLLFAGLLLPSLGYDFVWTDRGEILFGTIRLPLDALASAFVRPMSANLPAHLAEDVAQSYYRPVQVVLVSALHAAVGDNPAPFRAVNLCLGAATVGLVGLLLRRLTGDVRAAALGATVFALHPVQLENAVWIAGLSQSLASCFGTASLLAAVAGWRAAPGTPRSAAAALSLATLLLALLSKESAAAVPLMLLAALWLLESSSEEGGLRRASPFGRGLVAAQLGLTAVFFGLWRPYVLGSALASVPPLAGDMRLQILTAIASWPRAFAWLLVPWESTTSDVVRVATSAWSLRVLLGVGLVVGSLVAIRRLRDAGQPVAALGLVWMWIAFLPTSGLVPLTHLRGERYLAPSLLGLVVLLAALWQVAWARADATGRVGHAGGVGRYAATAMALLLVGFLAQRTWHRLPDWRSDETLFTRDVARDPLYREGYHELAKAYVQAGDLAAARRTLDDLLALGPRFAGHASFLREGDVAVMHCHLNLSLRTFSANERYAAPLRADPARAADAPLLGFCAAVSLQGLGEERAALAALDALHAVDHPLLRAQVPLEAASIHATHGRVEPTRAWLARIPANARLTPAQVAKRRALSRWVAGANAASATPRGG